METLTIYESKHSTGKGVAAYLQQKLRIDLQETDPVLPQEGYERIVCVGGIYIGRPAKQLFICIRANTKELAGKGVGMLLCGMSDTAPEKTVAENPGEVCYRQLAFSANIGSGLNFQKLGFLERKIIRMINKQEHLYEDKDAVLVGRLCWGTINSVITRQTHGA